MFGNKYDEGWELTTIGCFKSNSVEDEAAVVVEARSLSRIFTTVTFLKLNNHICFSHVNS